MSSSFMADIGAMGAASVTAKTSTSREGNTELKMEDFLTLMVVQLQNQTMDDTADTGEMLNQLVQMQMVTALSNMTDASIMSYASSLVGKEVTVGYMDSDNNLHEDVLEVIGTGVYNGQQVIFCDDGNMYQLSQIMAVGRIPEEIENPDDTEGDSEGDDLENEINNRIDQLVNDIQNGTYTDGTTGTDSESKDDTDIGDIGGVTGTETDNSAESSTETDSESGSDEPIGGNLLEGMLVDPNAGSTEYDGTQGAPTDDET